MAQGIRESARSWAKTRNKAKVKLPKSKVKRPATFFDEVTADDDAAYVGKVVMTALNWLHEHVDAAVRRPWEGESDFDKCAWNGSILITITLKHKHKRGVRIEATARLTDVVLGTASDTVAALKGGRLGRDLAARIEEHRTSHGGKSEWKQEYDSHRFYEEEQAGSVRAEGEFSDVPEEAPPSKPKKPKVVCEICGETDDKYPEWEGDCEHVIRNRKEAKRKSDAARERTARSKEAAEVRREALAESSDYTQGRSKK